MSHTDPVLADWEMGSEPLFIPSSRCQKRGAELANLIMIHHPNGAFIGLVRSGPVRIARSRLWRPNTYVACRSVLYGRGVCTYTYSYDSARVGVVRPACWTGYATTTTCPRSVGHAPTTPKLTTCTPPANATLRTHMYARFESESVPVPPYVMDRRRPPPREEWMDRRRPTRADPHPPTPAWPLTN